MGKICGKKLWGKSMGKIYGKNLWGKSMEKINSTFSKSQTCCNFSPLTAIKNIVIPDMGIFNGTFSYNKNCKKYR